MNDDKLWYGDNFIRLFEPNKNKWFIEMNKGNGWDVYYDESMGSEIAVFLINIPREICFNFSLYKNFFRSVCQIVFSRFISMWSKSNERTSHH